MHVEWIGVGALAQEVALRLSEGGVTPRVWALEQPPTDLARCGDVLVLDLPSADDVIGFLRSLEASAGQPAPGTVVISLAAGTPGSSEQIARHLVRWQAAFVDAPALGTTAICPSARALAGPAAACEKALPVLRVLCDKLVACGTRPGDAQAVRLIDRTMMVAAGLGAMEAFAAGRRRGLPLRAMCDVLTLGSGRNFTTRSVLPLLVNRKAEQAIPVSQLVSDMDAVIAIAIAEGAPTPIASVARAQLQMVANGLESGAGFEDVAERLAALAGTRMQDDAPEPAPTSAPGNILNTSPPVERSPTIGYVGLGAMGVPLARRLLSHCEVQVFDVCLDGARVLEAEGAVIARDLVSMAHDCDIVMLCLPSSTVVQEVLFGPEGLAQGLGPGKIVIDQTTGDPDVAVALSGRLQQLGVDLLEAPVSGGPETPGNGTAFMMCGGDRLVFERVEPVLKAIGPHVQYCGRTGSGHVAKLVNNASNICNRLIAYEAAVLGTRLGIDLEVLHEAINLGGGWSFASERVFKAVATQGRTATISLELSLKDIASAVKMGMRCQAPMQIADTVRSLFAMGVHRFGGDANVDDIARLFEELGGVRFAAARQLQS